MGRAGRGMWITIVAGLAWACSAEEAALLRVGELGYPAAMLAELPSGSLPALADLSAWGQLVRDGAEEEFFAPLAERARERSRFDNLANFLGAQTMELSEDDLRSAYESAPEWELELCHIVRLADEGGPPSERMQAFDEAEVVLERARSGEDFGALAGEFSEEPGAAERGGCLDPGRRGTWVEPFWDAAVALQPGEISPVVETLYGFHVIRLVDRQPVPFEQADRARLLRRLVPEEVASVAMQGWAATAPEPEVEATAVEALREELVSGETDFEVVVARGGDGVYTMRDAVLSWASVPAQERRLLQSDAGAFARWVGDDARRGLWAADAARLGAPPSHGVAEDEARRWAGLAMLWTETLGVVPSIDDGVLRQRAAAAAVSRSQDFAITRADLEGLRPLLRQRYPLVQAD